MTKINLIPRNNWDYDVVDLVKTVSDTFSSDDAAPNIKKYFNAVPVFTGSGRASLYALLKSLDLPPQAKVAVPLFCCTVVFDAIIRAGLMPKFVDSDFHDCNLSPRDLERKRRTCSAVVAVHMFGNPCDMDGVDAVANGIPVIEDCAQSMYSMYKGRKTGTLSAASFFSFRCGKYISAGEGSAIFCRDDDFRKRVEHQVGSFEERTLPQNIARSFTTLAKAALYRRPLYGTIGYPLGSRLDKKFNLTAKDGFSTFKIAPGERALADKRVAAFGEKIERQRMNAQRLLSKINVNNLSLPTENRHCTSNWHQFALRFASRQKRDAMADFLFANGIDSARYLDTVVEEARQRFGYAMGSCPNTEVLSKTVLLVPIHYYLRGRDIDRIARMINQFKG
ncbi:MAG TPA: DegT/DnrJ/EryC1/StrS family aminotransferase [Chitinivibrionales bacterium]|nr:DegT/DnrJ/EryC1/StrS family aminotransferase [Chitinivibrionales bacterium]